MAAKTTLTLSQAESDEVSNRAVYHGHDVVWNIQNNNNNNNKTTRTSFMGPCTHVLPPRLEHGGEILNATRRLPVSLGCIVWQPARWRRLYRVAASTLKMNGSNRVKFVSLNGLSKCENNPLPCTPQPCTLSYTTALCHFIHQSPVHFHTPQPCTLSYTTALYHFIQHSLVPLHTPQPSCTISYTTALHHFIHHSPVHFHKPQPCTLSVWQHSHSLVHCIHHSFVILYHFIQHSLVPFYTPQPCTISYTTALHHFIHHSPVPFYTPQPCTLS